MNWLIFFVGVLVGWLVELIIDFVFWRKRYQGSASEARLRIELAGSETKASQLESKLAGCQEMQEQYAARTAELQACVDTLQQSKGQTTSVTDEVVKESPADVDSEAVAAEDASGDSEIGSRSIPVIEVAEVVPDDLRKIEGIGPKIAGILNESGLVTFAQLAEADVARLRQILKEAGSRYGLANPETWPEQARIAATGDWDAVKALQNQLKGGQRKPQ